MHICCRIFTAKETTMRKLLVLLLTLPVFTSAQTADTIRVADNITARQLAEGIYLYTATAVIEGYGPVPSNGVIVVRQGDAVLLDTPTTDAQTRTLVEWIGRELKARVVKFVPNHWHSDCMGGLGYLHAQGVHSYASERTITDARREGKPVPQQAFTDSLRLDLHGTAIECHYLGGGHSDDNIVVWIPAARVLFPGCMVKDATTTNVGNTSDAMMSEWPATMDRILAKFPDARIVIPGHGTPGGLEIVRHTRTLVAGK